METLIRIRQTAAVILMAKHGPVAIRNRRVVRYKFCPYQLPKLNRLVALPPNPFKIIRKRKDAIGPVGVRCKRPCVRPYTHGTGHATAAAVANGDIKQPVHTRATKGVATVKRHWRRRVFVANGAFNSHGGNDLAVGCVTAVCFGSCCGVVARMHHGTLSLPIGCNSHRRTCTNVL